MGDGKGRELFAGSWNAEIYEPLRKVAKPEDVYCAKNRMSGMWTPEQPLWKHLESSGKKTLLFGGVNVRSTLIRCLVRKTRETASSSPFGQQMAG
jgi:phosphatidylethanolamine-binding protein